MHSVGPRSRQRESQSEPRRELTLRVRPNRLEELEGVLADRRLAYARFASASRGGGGLASARRGGGGEASEPDGHRELS